MAIMMDMKPGEEKVAPLRFPSDGALRCAGCGLHAELERMNAGCPAPTKARVAIPTACCPANRTPSSRRFVLIFTTLQSRSSRPCCAAWRRP